MTLPVAPLTLPADLVGQPNGMINENLMSLCGIGNFRMHHLASRALRALIAAYPPFTETATGTYRTYAQQVQLFNERYTLVPLQGRPTKVWNGRTYWQKPGVAMAAVPGTSNHGLGLAIDFAEQLDADPAPESVSSQFVDWLCANAITYGYSAETQSEAWHWRYVTGDRVPQAVLDFESPSEEDDDMAEKIQVPGDAAIFIRSGLTCTWASDTAVTTAWEDEGLVQSANVARQVDRIFLKGLELRGPMPNNNVTKAADFAKWTP